MPNQNKKRVYYAHSMSIYGTLQEARDVVTLEALGFEVVNPSDDRFNDAVGIIRENADAGTDPGETIMKYFEREVLGCDAVAFRAHPGGDIPAGVGKEIDVALGAGLPVIELPGFIRTRLGVEQTRQYLRETGER